jgi:uncharacterized protein (DUF169 family)
MSEYNWDIYDRDWGNWPPAKQGDLLIEELKLHGDPIALAWFPHGSLPPKLEHHVYRGELKMVHCQFMQRARFRGETYILEGSKSRPGPPVCNGDAYTGLCEEDPRLGPGLVHSRTDPSTGLVARLGIFGSPAASRRSLVNYYHIVPPDIQYLAIAPLSDCPFDPDVVTLVCDPRQATMALRALQYHSGLAAIGETGPGTCSSSWVASYLTGEPRYTLGCHGVFGTMGIDPKEVCVSIPGEQMPTMCSVLETWREKGKPMFTEQPPNEERDFIHAPYQGPYRAHARIQHERGEVKPDPNAESYVPWADRRKKKR